MIHRFVVTTKQIIEIETDETVSVDDVQDSVMDTALDGQDETFQTSDGKFNYVPKDILLLTVEKE